MKLYKALFYLLNLLLEVIYFISYPLLRLIGALYQYNESFQRPARCQERPILIHAASVGEVNAAAALIRELLQEGYPIHINTVTVTGRALARSIFPQLSISLAPVDVLHLRQRQMRILQPRLILIVETEIWPNMLYAATKAAIPIVFVNARLSEKSLKNYLKIAPLLQMIGSSIKAIMAQSAEDKMRFEKLFTRVPVTHAGNLKFCLSLPDFDESTIKADLGIREDDFVISWGSSRPGEEELILGILAEPKRSIPALKVILAPRHPKRIPELEKLLSGTNYQKLSKLDPQRGWNILLIDTLGHLTKAYAISDLVIVGGSFYDFGGHNPLEPAYYSKAIIIGEYYSSCQDSVRILAAANAIIISDKDSLLEDILALAANRPQREDLGRKAKIVLTENAHALNVHVRGIKQCLN
ncbi:MAG: 3-deoxy-D-manno-octulosonic acid transferase [Candidatus Cloacimonetes bacterium]|jgi:3-deoxy-D-manno-octulosonic-acid transferase|nr:3-deoxy-D-manno-octulosonic acid transferase [Candidatus Cloacimonadota bacterium]MCB5286767.1 3-deoxy-D-manno-octulosonic acid transferase [Candidatus Cloacimonadota bacterium]MCK9184194.1 3-deoxy-D-manno-octulosonic acid transferase [Candidatus Cloacimonadota bacterium]MCK9583532.1 3-deoxy-D-manno-octulosonic acid transferase [Candidatus Cloacimonadota bacterium]MDY0229088.1 glycosyltransferase N-terminal domain-containing protein [Candidatus Cloacimonadaceae bacterium]